MRTSALFSLSVLAFSGCGVKSENGTLTSNSDTPQKAQDVVVGSSDLGLAGPQMSASFEHFFDFTSKKTISQKVLSGEGLFATVVTGMNTDNSCRLGVFDPGGKVYTFYLGRFVSKVTGRSIPFRTKVDILQNIAASGDHPGLITLGATQGEYDQNGRAVVRVQFCAKNVMKQSYVRGFKVTLTPLIPTLRSSDCVPNASEPTLCTSKISWANAPSNSCVFINGQTFACGGSSGSATAPWVSYNDTSAAQFLLADKNDPSIVHATVSPKAYVDPALKPSMTASDCRRNSDQPVLCSSTISWKNAPPGACVYVKGSEPAKLMACGGASGSAIAPWILWSNPGSAQFMLADKNDSSNIYASAVPKAYTGANDD